MPQPRGRLESRARALLLALLAAGVAIASGAPRAFAADEPCPVCGRETRGAALGDPDSGRRYHAACVDAARVPRCDHCEGPAPRRVVSAAGEFHESCFVAAIAPRCPDCGLAVGRYRVGVPPSHPSCFRRRQRGEPVLPGSRHEPRLRCDLCDEPLGEELRVGSWGEIYHPRHEDSVPHCDACGRLAVARLSGAPRACGDGRTLCGLCDANAVESGAQAEALLRDVCAAMGKRGIRVDAGRVELSPSDASELADATGTSRRSRGVSVHGFDRRGWSGSTIHALMPLPEAELRGVLAHELGHVWLSSIGLGDRPAWAVEGTCNLFQLWELERAPGALRDHLVEKLEQDDDEVYGVGFRRVRDAVERVGWRAWVERLAALDAVPERMPGR